MAKDDTTSAQPGFGGNTPPEPAGPCLSDIDLEQHLTDPGSSGTEEAILRHLNLCADCRSSLEEVKANMGVFDDIHAVMTKVNVFDPVHDAILVANQTIGQYEIIEQIGQGGMGRVYKANDPLNNRSVAIKILSCGTDNTRNDKMKERLLQEAHAQIQLHHDFIVGIFDTGEYLGNPYIVMELVEGHETLQDRLNQPKRLDPRLTAALVRKIALALDYTHSHNIVHRDIKPANILMNGETPLLTDFGVAFTLDSGTSRLTSAGAVVGTLCYMSPEQVSGKLPQGSSDVYSLGASMYEMLTGRLPFEASGSPQMIDKIVNQDPRPPTKLRADLDSALESICIKCMEKDPALRYDSAGELAADLERYLSGKKVMAPTIHWQYRRARNFIKARRRAVTFASIALVASFVAYGFANVYMFERQASVLKDRFGAIPDSGKDYSTAFLRRAAKDSDPMTRMHVIEALSRQDPQMRNELFWAIATGDPSPQVRAALAQKLAVVPALASTELCEILLKDPHPSVVGHALNLARKLRNPDLLPFLEQHAYGDDNMRRSHAMGAILNLPHKYSTAFVSTYLKKGAPAGRQRLLNRIFLGHAPFTVPDMIGVLENEEATSEEKERALNTLNRNRQDPLGPEPDTWKAWWRNHQDRWALRTCLKVKSASADTMLMQGDVIWTVDGNPVVNEARKPRLEGRLEVIRRQRLISLHGKEGSMETTFTYVVIMDDQPVSRLWDATRDTRPD